MPLTVQAQKFKLSGSGCTSTATSINVQNFYLPDGTTAITTANFGSTTNYLTLEPGTSREEQISFTGVTDNGSGSFTLTGVTRGLRFVSPYDEVTANKFSHAGGSILVITNTAAFYGLFLDKATAQTITSVKTFSTTPIISNVPTTGTEAANKTYVDGVAVAGAPNADTTTKGIVEEATQAEVDAKTATGGTGAKLFQNLSTQRSTLLSDYVADTGVANAYIITPVPAITAYVTGQIFTLKLLNTNTLTSTINVSGLGVKTIKKLDGATNLASGDIVAGQLVRLQYDGTNMQMGSPTVKVATSQLDVGTSASQVVQLNGSAQYPAVDGSLITKVAKLFSTFASYTTSDDTNENTVFTTTFTGGLLSTTGMIKIRVPIQSTPNSSASITYAVRLKYGGSTIHTLTITCPNIGGGNAVAGNGWIDAHIINNASVSSQFVGFYSFLGHGASTSNQVTCSGGHVDDTTSAINTASNQTLAMTIQRTGGGSSTVKFFRGIIEYE